MAQGERFAGRQRKGRSDLETDREAVARAPPTRSNSASLRVWRKASVSRGASGKVGAISKQIGKRLREPRQLDRIAPRYVYGARRAFRGAPAERSERSRNRSGSGCASPANSIE